MSAPAFDPNAIMEEVFASAKAPPPATIATLRHSGPNCRNVATVATDDAPNDESAALIEERAGLCADSIPPLYLDAWARLNCQKPSLVSEAEWRQALDDGGRFLDAWGWVSESDWAWTAGELFDIPRVGNPGGLIWQLQGALVEAYGPDHVRLSDGRAIERNEMGMNNGAYRE